MFILSFILYSHLSIVFFIFEFNTSSRYEWGALLILALFTTAIGHTLFVKSFKYFSVSTASLMSSIQPIYGILLGLIFLGEIPISKTIIGGVLIISTVIIESILSKKRRQLD